MRDNYLSDILSLNSIALLPYLSYLGKSIITVNLNNLLSLLHLSVSIKIILPKSLMDIILVILFVVEVVIDIVK